MKVLGPKWHFSQIGRREIMQKLYYSVTDFMCACLKRKYA